MAGASEVGAGCDCRNTPNLAFDVAIVKSSRLDRLLNGTYFCFEGVW